MHREISKISFNDVPLPVWIFDPKTLAILATNDAAVQSYGYSEDEILSMSLKDLRPEEDAPSAADYQGTTHSEIPAYLGTWRHRRKDGSIIWVEILRSGTVFEGRKAALALARDVTGHRRADEDLIRSQATLARAQKIARLGSWEIEYKSWPPGAGDIVITWSDEMYRVLGLTPSGDAPLTMEDFTQRVYPDDRAAVAKAIAQAQNSTGRFDIEHRIIRPDSSIRYVRQSAEVAADGNGRPVRMTGIIQDTTDYKRLEEQFQQAQKMESVGRLAGAVAHDFNNLLTVIKGYADLVNQRMDPADPLREFLIEIRKAGEKANALTTQLLAVSRRQIRQAQVLNLNAVVQDVETILRRLIGEDIDLITSCYPERTLVVGDAGQLHQVLMNLAVNSRDAMPNGGKLIIATDLADVDEDYSKQHGDLDPGRYVLLIVSDTGCGMTDEVRRHLFEPFFTTKPRGTGTGLGLATVWGIVKQSGGSIRAHSAPGAGTTFTVYLPRAEAEPLGRETEYKGPKDARGTETVLVVEDQDDVRKFVSAILGNRGYTVLSASDGQSAIEAFNRAMGRVDLLITDVVMPGMTGKELAGQLTDAHPGLMVLFMSGYAEDVIAHRGVLDTAVSFISKPFTAETLASKVRETLDLHRKDTKKPE